MNIFGIARNKPNRRLKHSAATPPPPKKCSFTFDLPIVLTCECYERMIIILMILSLFGRAWHPFGWPQTQLRADVKWAPVDVEHACKSHLRRVTIKSVSWLVCSLQLATCLVFYRYSKMERGGGGVSSSSLNRCLAFFIFFKGSCLFFFSPVLRAASHFEP